MEDGVLVSASSTAETASAPTRARREFSGGAIADSPHGLQSRGLVRQRGGVLRPQDRGPGSAKVGGAGPGQEYS